MKILRPPYIMIPCSTTCYQRLVSNSLDGIDALILLLFDTSRIIWVQNFNGYLSEFTLKYQPSEFCKPI